MIAGPASGTPGTVKITDFGIAKITASEQFTMTGAIVGTPHYMSPEQVQGQPVDGRSDQFSLAVIAFEMLTGREAVYRRAPHYCGLQDRGGRTGPASPAEPDPRRGDRSRAAQRAWRRSRTGVTAPARNSPRRWKKPVPPPRGGSPMPRGGGLNEPTVAECKAPAIVLPPSRRRIECHRHRANAGPRANRVS